MGVLWKGFGTRGGGVLVFSVLLPVTVFCFEVFRKGFGAIAREEEV